MSAARQLPPDAGAFGELIPSRRCGDTVAAGASDAPAQAGVLGGRGRCRALRASSPAASRRARSGTRSPRTRTAPCSTETRSRPGRSRAVEPGPHHLDGRQAALDLPAPRAARTDLEVRAAALEHRHERGAGRFERREARAGRRGRYATHRTSTVRAPRRRRVDGAERAAVREAERTVIAPSKVAKAIATAAAVTPRPSPRPARERAPRQRGASIPRQIRASASSLVGSTRPVLQRIAEPAHDALLRDRPTCGSTMASAGGDSSLDGGERAIAQRRHLGELEPLDAPERPGEPHRRFHSAQQFRSTSASSARWSVARPRRPAPPASRRRRRDRARETASAAAAGSDGAPGSPRSAPASRRTARRLAQRARAARTPSRTCPGRSPRPRPGCRAAGSSWPEAAGVPPVEHLAPPAIAGERPPDQLFVAEGLRDLSGQRPTHEHAHSNCNDSRAGENGSRRMG